MRTVTWESQAETSPTEKACQDAEYHTFYENKLSSIGLGREKSSLFDINHSCLSVEEYSKEISFCNQIRKILPPLASQTHPGQFEHSEHFLVRRLFALIWLFVCLLNCQCLRTSTWSIRIPLRYRGVAGERHLTRQIIIWILTNSPLRLLLF